MRKLLRTDRRCVPLLVLASLATAACGPPERLDLTVREDPVDIVYGDQSEPAPPRRAPDASLVPGSPGLIAPPPGLSFAPKGTKADVRPRQQTQKEERREEAGPACRTAAADAPAPEKAPPLIEKNPVAGDYSFRREGTVERGAGGLVTLPEDVTRTVENVTERFDPAWALPIREFDVVQQDGDATTRTSYRVDLEGLYPGLKIVKIETSSPQGTDSFVPQPALRIFNLPAQPELGYTQEQAVDPLTGTTMSLNHKTVGHAVLDVCGTLVGVWRVQIYESPTQRGLNDVLTTNGYFSVATQSGGLILHDDLRIEGVDGGETYRLESVSTITSLKPAAGRS